MGAALSVEQKLQDTVQFAGNEVTLTCRVNKDGASARWWHGDVEVQNNNKFSMVQDGMKFVLRIRNVQRSEEGFYKIKVKYYNEEVESTAMVTVKENLRVSRTFQDVKASAGQEVILKCEVNREDVTAEWKKDDKLLTEGRNVVMEQRGKEFILKIKHAQKSDTGFYTCLVKSGSEEVKISAEVAVEEFDREWRSINFNPQTRNKLEAELTQLRPQLEPLRILLYGPIGSGKSSFINSIDIVFKGKISTGALADAAGAGISFTRRFQTHKIEKKNTSEFLPFVLNDVMGLEDEKSKGVHPDDIMSILKGHVKENYLFEPSAPLSEEDPDYKRDPSPTDKVHCLVCLLPADKISFLTDDIFAKMRSIREQASDMGIPQVVVMTKPDMACQVVKSDLRKIYYSMKIKEKMQECSNRLGVPMNCIFPVKNYHEVTELVLEVDVLILKALSTIIHFANDYARQHVVR
ncbi:interferon-induced protein 44-like [Denticeps clupeoides]|uniref:Ig-like domain-containing protein n=1 Tax=Denticeps clupeoides TaxID=299321 RepID=A0AAY3ZZ64_9TELE|nr:interferon-induced protein 44-like [Denticeps clupeoides]